jgi:hypothetical protein
MLKIYFIYKVAGKKIQKGYIKFNSERESIYIFDTTKIRIQ